MRGVQRDLAGQEHWSWVNLHDARTWNSSYLEYDRGKCLAQSYNCSVWDDTALDNRVDKEVSEHCEYS